MVAFKALSALGLLALLVASTTALSTQEIAGLQAMMASMPGLTSPFGIMHWSNSDIGNACNWRGITCKENSIVTLYAQNGLLFPVKTAFFRRQPRGPLRLRFCPLSPLSNM